MQVCKERNAALEAESISLEEEIEEISSINEESHSTVVIVKKKTEEDEISMINIRNQAKDQKDKCKVTESKLRVEEDRSAELSKDLECGQSLFKLLSK